VQALRTFANSPRGELAFLFAASCAVVMMLFVAIASGSAQGMSGGSTLRHVVLTTLVLGLVLLGAALLGLPQKMFDQLTLPPPEIAAMREDLKTAEAVIQAEAQIVVLWQRGERVRVVVHSLRGIAGLPSDSNAIERFGAWLDAPSAQLLKQSLDQLFSAGTAFNMLVRTQAGAHLEADGRAAGARAILRLRDITGHRRDLAAILDKHRELTREIAACRTVLEALPMPVWMSGGTGHVTWANAAYIKAVAADSLADVAHRPVELLEARQRERALVAIGKAQTFADRLPLVTGGRMNPHDVSMLPFDGGSVGVAIDVGAIEDAKGETDRRTAAYDRTLHRVATGVAIYGRDGRLSFFNDAYRDIWQLDADWLAQNPSAEEILDRLRGLSRLPQVANYRDWKVKVLSSSRDGNDFEDWWHLLDGRTIHVTAEKRPDGGVTFLFDDVTQRLALESRFNAMIDTQRETLDGLKEGVAVFAPDGRLQLSNKAFAQVWKLSRKMLAEGPHIDAIARDARVLHDDPELWQLIIRSITGISDRRQAVTGQFVRADQCVIDYAITPLPDGATLITFADVTDVRRAERALIERNDALVAADRLKSQFIRHVSYELRTPLTTIIGYTDLMQVPSIGPLNERQREFLGDIEASSKSLLSVINDILDLATIDAGGLELKVAPVDVKPIVDAALLGVKDRARVANVAFDIDLQVDARNFVADDKRVKQILYNLLSNAIGFSKAGDTVKVQAWRERGMLAFAVEDQGVGIPPEQQGSVFERFESRSQGSKHRGAGLGLSIVKSLVELHGGNVAIASEPGRGTRVTVRFPEAGIAPRSREQDAA
jgi:signal transduction histidine kinase